MTPESECKKKKPIAKYERCQYQQEDLENAFSSVRSLKLSVNKASQQYNIPKSTLINKLNQNQPAQCKLGRSTILTTEEESKIKIWILNKAKLGFPMRCDDVKDAVQKVLKESKRENPFNDDRPGRKWMDLFLKRYPEISLKNSESLSKARACVTEDGIRAWFAELKNHIEIELEVKEIFQSPERIINLDELGMSTCPKTGKVLGPRGEKNLYKIATGMEEQSISVLCAFSANGESFDPMIIYAYKKMPRDIAASLPHGFAIGRSDTGWINSANFYEYIANILYPRLVERQTKFPVLILCDGHKSHINMELHHFCVEKKIILYCLLANSTHILQPCDVGIFYPLKSEWKKVVTDHSQKSTGAITKVNFASLFKIAFDKAVKSEIIKKSFEACGLYPFNPNRVDYSKCISTRRLILRQEMLSNHETNTLSSSAQNNSLDNLNAKMLMMIEAQMPSSLVKEFIDTYETRHNPSSEILLYNIWENFKNLVIFDDLKNQSAMEEVNINQNLLETSAMSLLDKCEIQFDDSLVVIDEQELMYQNELEFSTIPSSSFNNVDTEDDMKTSSFLLESMTELDVLNNNNEASAMDSNMSIEYKNASADSTSNNNGEDMNISVDILSNDRTENNNISAKSSEVNVNNIWEKHLHYPKIDNKSKKKKKNTTDQIYAITSDKLEKLEMEKMKLEIKEKQLKLQRQAERDAKKIDKEKAAIERKVKKEERLLKKKIEEQEKLIKRERREEKIRRKQIEKEERMNIRKQVNFSKNQTKN